VVEMSRYQVVIAQRLVFVQSVAGVKDKTYKYQFDPLNSRHPIACDHVRVKVRTVVAKLG
jgi:hypothetical protein